MSFIVQTKLLLLLMRLELCAAAEFYLDSCFFFPPLGLMDSEICQRDSSHKWLSKLLKYARTLGCFFRVYLLKTRKINLKCFCYDVSKRNTKKRQVRLINVNESNHCRVDKFSWHRNRSKPTIS